MFAYQLKHLSRHRPDKLLQIFSAYLKCSSPVPDMWRIAKEGCDKLFPRLFTMQNWLYLCLQSIICALDLAMCKLFSEPLSKKASFKRPGDHYVRLCMHCKFTLWNWRRPGAYASAHMALKSLSKNKRSLQRGNLQFPLSTLVSGYGNTGSCNTKSRNDTVCHSLQWYPPVFQASVKQSINQL